MLKKGSFIYKVLSILNNPSLNHLIRWNDGGNAFYVVDQDGLANEVLAKYFKHKNFASFVRQLHFYGFTRSSLGMMIEFANENFIRGREDLLDNMKRKHNLKDRTNYVTKMEDSSFILPNEPICKIEENSSGVDMTFVEQLRSELYELRHQNTRLLDENEKLRLKVQMLEQKGLNTESDFMDVDYTTTSATLVNRTPSPNFEERTGFDCGKEVPPSYIRSRQLPGYDHPATQDFLQDAGFNGFFSDHNGSLFNHEGSLFDVDRSDHWSNIY